MFFATDTGESTNTTYDLNELTLTNHDNKESGSYDTIDTLPRIDHYRNILSFTSSEPKTRPTLEVLHGTVNPPIKHKLSSTIDLNSEITSPAITPIEQSPQNDSKPKIEIVKFGWIVGVLVGN